MMDHTFHIDIIMGSKINHNIHQMDQIHKREIAWARATFMLYFRYGPDGPCTKVTGSNWKCIRLHILKNTVMKCLIQMKIRGRCLRRGLYIGFRDNKKLSVMIRMTIGFQFIAEIVKMGICLRRCHNTFHTNGV